MIRSIDSYLRSEGQWKVQTKQTHLFSIYVALLYVSMFLNFFSYPILWYLLIALSPLIFLACNQRLKFKKNIYILIFYICLSTFFIIASALIQNREINLSVLNIISILSSLLNGYLLSQQKIKLKIIATPIILFILFSFFIIIKGTDPNFVFTQSSRNTFSWLAIFGSSLFYICQLKKGINCKISIWPACCGFIISVLSLGRSGIISSGIILVGIIMYKLKNHKVKAILFFFLMVLFFLLSYHLFKPQIEFIVKVTMRFTYEDINNNPRIEIAGNYMKNIASIKWILLGAKLSTINYMEQWSFNLHNSFLNFHSFMGIGSIILIMLIIIGIIRKAFRSILLGFIGIALLLRISTDTGAFVGPMDFLLFYFLFSEMLFYKTSNVPRC